MNPQNDTRHSTEALDRTPRARALIDHDTDGDAQAREERAALEGWAMDVDTRGALVGDVLMRLVSRVLEGVKNSRDNADPDPAAGLDTIIGAMDHLVVAQDALDGLYLRGEAPADLEDEASRFYGVGWGL